jgi:hypothetical protein
MAGLEVALMADTMVVVVVLVVRLLDILEILHIGSKGEEEVDNLPTVLIESVVQEDQFGFDNCTQSQVFVVDNSD